MNLKSYDQSAVEFLKGLKVEEHEVPVSYSTEEREEQRHCYEGKIRLPVIIINRNKLEFGETGSYVSYVKIIYEIDIRSMWESDMNAIIEQIMEKHKISSSFKIKDLQKEKINSDSKLITLRYKGHIEIKVSL